MSELVVERTEQELQTVTTRDLLRAMGLPLTYMSPELEALVSETVEISALAIQELAVTQPDLQGPAKEDALKDLRAQYRAQTSIDATEQAFRTAALRKFGERVRSIDHFAYTLSNAVPALVPKMTRELSGAFKQGDAAAVQACTGVLEQFGLVVTLPEEPHAEVVVAPEKTNVVPIAKVATVGAVIVGLGLGVVSPAAAAESSPSPTASSISAPAASTEQPSAELQPIVQTSPTETATPTTTESPDPTETDTLVQSEPSTPVASETPEATPLNDQVVYGVETPTSDVQAPVFSKQETSAVINVEEIDAPVVPVDTQPPAEQQPDVLSNDELKDLAKKLDPEYAQIYTNLIVAYKSGNLNGFSDETAFNVANPYEKGQKLALRMSKKVQQELLQDIREFQEILKNNPSTIEAIINDESIVIEEALKMQLAEFIQSNDFIEGAEGLTIEQRIALVKSTIKIHGLLSTEAQRVTPLELAAAKKAEAAKPKPDGSKSKYDQLVDMTKKAPKYAGLESYDLSESELDVIDNQKLTSEQKDFIKRVYPLLIRYQDKYQYNAMVVMSMIIQENNLNPDNDLFAVAHNILSIKAPRGYSGPTIEAPTWEQYDGTGERTIIGSETWIKFDSDEACIQYFVEHILGLKAYDDAQTFYKSPELFIMGLLNNMQKDGDVEKAHHLGATSYATALKYVYGTLTLSAQYGLNKVGPDNYRIGYDWSSKTTEGFIIPNQVRGNVFHHAANTDYASKIGNGPRATIFSSVAMAVSHFSEAPVSPARVKELSNNASSLREVLNVVESRKLHFEQTKATGSNIAKILHNGKDSIVIVQGKNGAYLIDLATKGTGKQGFFVLDPSSTLTTLEPWSFSELQNKLGVTQVFIVTNKPQKTALPHSPSQRPGIGKLPHNKGNKPEGKHEKGSQFPATLPDGTLYLSQWDNRWANKAYPKPNGEFRNISQSGCEPTTAAWILRTLGVDLDTTPVEQANANLRNGGRNSSLEAVREMAKKYGLKFNNISSFSTQERIESIQHALSINPKTGKTFGVVMASGQDASIYDPAPFTSSGHVLGIRDIRSNGDTKVMDPNSYKKSLPWWDKNGVVARANYIYIVYR